MSSLIKRLRAIAESQVRDSEYAPDETIAWEAADRIKELERKYRMQKTVNQDQSESYEKRIKGLEAQSEISYAMEQNSRIQEQYKRIKELDATVRCLWDLIDDIDTASDIAKSDDIWYRKRIEALVDHRWATGVTTDGYTLDLTKLTSTKYSDTFLI
jgi:hypothetical protein